MKATLGYLVVVILLLVGGEAFRRTATFEDRLAAAQEHLTTQNPAERLAAEDDESAPQLVASLPVVGPPIRAELRKQRALAAYWRADYSGAAAATSGADVSGDDGALLFIAANAMFRELPRQPGDRQALTRSLDAVLKAYVSALEADPDAVDAAYNYEFVSRLRGAFAAGRPTILTLPSESNMNGEQGSPPTETKPGEFNIIVPLRPEEREEQIDPRAGAVPQRKG